MRHFPSFPGKRESSFCTDARREWKVELIEKENPDWLDLYDHLIGV